MRDIIDLILPRVCLVCRRRNPRRVLCGGCEPRPVIPSGRCIRCFSESGGGGAELCAACELFPPPFDRLRFLSRYEGECRDLIHAMKYRPSEALASYVGRVVGESLSTLFSAPYEWDLIHPIPSSSRSFRVRLFNQCAGIAVSMRRAASLSAPIDLGLTTHADRRPAQASLAHKERLRNARDVFSLRRRVEGGRILLVEDVVTTGSTVASMCRLLFDQGARRVDVIALARAESWQEYRSRVHGRFGGRRSEESTVGPT